MIKHNILIGLLALTLLTSCESSKLKKEAEAKAKEFFSYLKQGEEKKLTEIYKNFGKFEIFYKSDSAVITSSDFNNDITTVSVHNRFTNDLGKLNERNILLFFKKDTAGKLVIYDSKGLTDFSKKNEYIFGTKTGCISTKDTTDQQIILALEKTNKVFIDKALDVYLELKKDIRVTDWSWETLYSGSASGKGIVVNNSRFDIPSLKYTVTFKTRSGTPITTDKGTISYDPIPAGGSTSFSFYSDYVGGASTATIELNFDDNLIFNYLAEKEWTGKECDDYFKTHSNKLTKK